MHRLGPGLPRGGHDGVDPQVALPRRRRADRHRFVGQLDVQGVPIGGRKHRDGADAQAPRRPDHAAGDLATVGDQDLAEHGAPYIRNTPKPPAARRGSDQGSTGALKLAESASAKVMRVSAGAITPSSQSRALA